MWSGEGKKRTHTEEPGPAGGVEGYREREKKIGSVGSSRDYLAKKNGRLGLRRRKKQRTTYPRSKSVVSKSTLSGRRRK